MGLRCLLGHDYDEPRTEGERDERGNEVVVTIREYQQCVRCGHRHMLSENKEITVESPQPAPVEPTATSTESTGELGELQDPLPTEDDGIILDDSTDREYGEWPPLDTDDEPADDSAPAPWPSHDDLEDEGFAAEPDDGTPLDDVDFTRGNLEPITTADPTTDPAPAAGHGDPPTIYRSSKDDIQFECPACGETTPALDSSLRAGDICPACQDGYLREDIA